MNKQETVAEFVGSSIRRFRQLQGLSQTALAQAVGTTANTVSRWETATYRPSIEDLEKMAHVFRVAIADFFPAIENKQMESLARIARQLTDEDVEELIIYAEFRARRSQAG